MKTQKSPMVIIPTPQKLKLVYKNSKGEISNYLISPPIEKKEDSFVAYKFSDGKSSGIRSFKFEGVISLN